MFGYEKLKIVDYFRKTDALEEYQEFSRSQWNSLEENKQIQWCKLEKLLRHAYEHVPYYRKLFDRCGMKPWDIKSDKDFQRIPLLTKDIIRENYEDMFADNKKKFGMRKKETGGSTGTPLIYFASRKSHSALWAFIYRSWHIGGWNPGDRIVMLGDEAILPAIGKFRENIYKRLNNCLILSAVNMTDENMCKWVKQIKKYKIQYVYSFASSIYLFARYLENNGLEVPYFKAIYTTAEVLQSKFRKTIEKVFDCEVFDTYGGCDGAGYAFECEQHNGLHIVTENSYMEIVNEKDEVVVDGKEGEVVSTDLYSFGMPFIRYKVGDCAAIDVSPCPCKRGLPRLKNILGRTFDFVTDINGTKIHGIYFDALMGNFNWIKQFFVHQISRDNITVYLIPDHSCVDEDLKKIRRILRKKFNGMQIDVRITDAVPMAKSNKFKYVVNDAITMDNEEQYID